MLSMTRSFICRAAHHMASFFSLVHPENLTIYVIYSSVIFQRAYESIVNACKLVLRSVME